MSEIFLFFDEKIETALKNQRKYLPDDVKVYILHLLSNSVSDPLILSDKRVYLFDLYQDTLTGNSLEREMKLKKLGDHTITIVGCFPASVLNTSTGIDYYVTMGRAAYTSARGISDKEIYQKTYIYYLDIISILHEVSNSCSQLNQKDLYKIYDAWRSTNSVPFGNFLIKNGVSVVGCIS